MVSAELINPRGYLDWVFPAMDWDHEGTDWQHCQQSVSQSKLLLREIYPSSILWNSNLQLKIHEVYYVVYYSISRNPLESHSEQSWSDIIKVTHRNQRQWEGSI